VLGKLPRKEEIMEQKKTLWIIVSVGAFLLAVLGAALIFYKPSGNMNVQPVNMAVENPNTNGWSNSANVNQQENTSITDVKKVDDMVVLSNNTSIYEVEKQDIAKNPTGTTFNLNDGTSEIKTEPVNNTPNINITVNIPEQILKEDRTTTQTSDSESIYITSNYYVENKIQESKVDVKKLEKEEKQKARKVVEKTETVKVTSKPVAKKVEKQSAPKEKGVTRYWVQVASYSNKKGAENARSILDENKIPSDIFTYTDTKNNLFYRVRIGPYTTKSEAEYWKTRIEEIDFFKTSQCYVTTTTDN
jgi:cell division protein FtsN